MRSPVMQPSTMSKQAYTSSAYSGMSSPSPFVSKSSVGAGIDMTKQSTKNAGISSSRPFVSAGAGMDLKAGGQVVSERQVSREEMASGGNLVEGPDQTRQSYGQQTRQQNYSAGIARSTVSESVGTSYGAVGRSFGDRSRFTSGAASVEYSSAVPRKLEQSAYIGAQRTYEQSSLIGGRSSSAMARPISQQPRSASVRSVRAAPTSTSFPTSGATPMQVGYGSAAMSTYGGGMTMI